VQRFSVGNGNTGLLGIQRDGYHTIEFFRSKGASHSLNPSTTASGFA